VPELSTYRGKRRADRTPEPVPPDGPLPRGEDDTFVIQEHHARRLHWDFRLERGGVLVSWAVPRGLPLDPKTNHLAVHTEDHPMDYAAFEGRIPAGEYGGGKVLIWDRGRYETEKWTDREVMVVLHGSRISGRYVLFQTRGRDWMVHRMDPPPDPDWRPLPARIDPMYPVRRTRLPAGDGWVVEFGWGGLRAQGYVDGGILRLATVEEDDVGPLFPEVRALGPELGSRPAVLDGELIALGADGRPDAARLARRIEEPQRAPARPRRSDVAGSGDGAGSADGDGARSGRRARSGPSESVVRRLRRDHPVVFVLYDVLHLDGRPTVDLPYTERRALLAGLELNGAAWQTAPSFPRSEAAAVRAAGREQGLPAVLARRLAAPYRAGRSPDWISVPL
jgi:bifunctional non-homologous end joining protein LigD